MSSMMIWLFARPLLEYLGESDLDMFSDMHLPKKILRSKYQTLRWESQIDDLIGMSIPAKKEGMKTPMWPTNKNWFWMFHPKIEGVTKSFFRVRSEVCFLFFKNNIYNEDIDLFAFASFPGPPMASFLVKYRHTWRSGPPSSPEAWLFAASQYTPS